MSRYVLFGINSVTRQLIRKSKFQFLCPFPNFQHESLERSSEYSALKHFGAQPIQFDFRTLWTAETTEPEALQHILKGTKGVIWAIDPRVEERAIWGNYRDQPEEYLRDFKSVLSAMSMENGPRNLLSLIPSDNKLPLGSGGFLASYMMEAVESQKQLDWAFVQPPENSFSELVDHPGSSGRRDPTMNDLVVTTMNDLVVSTMTRILEMDDFNGTVFELDTVRELKRPIDNLKTVQSHAIAGPLAPKDLETRTALTPSSVAAMQAFLDESVPDFRAAIRDAASATSVTRASADSQLTSTPTKPTTAIERFINFFAMPFKSEDNRQPRQSSPNPTKSSTPSTSVQSTPFSTMTQLLEAVRKSRSHRNLEQENQQKRDQHVLRGREIARLEALKKGLPTPGANVLVWRNDHPPSTLRMGFKRAAISIHGDAGIPYIPSRLTKSPRQVASVTDKATMERTTLTRRRPRYVLETLNDVLADKSADFLSSHLAMPLPSVEGGSDFYNTKVPFPRSRYKGTGNGRVKR